MLVLLCFCGDGDGDELGWISRRAAVLRGVEPYCAVLCGIVTADGPIVWGVAGLFAGRRGQRGAVAGWGRRGQFLAGHSHPAAVILGGLFSSDGKQEDAQPRVPCKFPNESLSSI